jgi:hypothetical protein
MHVVPIEDFDLGWHERAIQRAGNNRFEVDGQVFPSDADHAADKQRIAQVKRGLAALTPAQRRSSRWPTRAELKRILEKLSQQHSYELRFGPYTGPWQQGSLSAYNGDRSVITSSITVNTSSEGTYYCEAHADILRVFAEAVAQVAGPQVTYLGEDYSRAEFTALYAPASPATKARPATATSKSNRSSKPRRTAKGKPTKTKRGMSRKNKR